MSAKKSLCNSRAERKSSFKKGAADKFVVEVSQVKPLLSGALLSKILFYV